MPALRESESARNRLDELLGGCMALQKMYGRDIGNAATIISLFQRILADYPASKVVKAFETWLERSQEFPTPADIISLIKRNGKPPLRESDIIAIRKKDGADRTDVDWRMLREWDEQQRDGWRDYPDAAKEAATQGEITRLRMRVKELEAENARAWGIVKQQNAAMASMQDMAKNENKGHTEAKDGRGSWSGI